jgi:trk system potassium uptake protein TrkA
MRVLIVGGGEVGSYLTGLLLAQGHAVTVLDVRGAALAALRQATPDALCLEGSGTDPARLEAAGIHIADMVVAVTGADETNLVVASLARFVFASPRVVSRINNPHNSWMFTPAMGVDVALNQADVIAHLIAQTLA